MFTVTLFQSFSKAENSTAVPSGGDNFPCLMVEPCGILNPSISFNQGNDWNPHKYNYAYIADFERYYWTGEWTFDHGRWYVSLSVDPLASWKNSILNLTEYVLRSASAYDTYVIDNLYPAKANVSSVTYEKEIWEVSSKEDGTVILGIIGKNGTSFGSVGYFQATYQIMQMLGERMFTDTGWIDGADAGKDIGDSLLKCLVNPSQYLQSVTWFPFRFTASESASNINMGWWDTGLATFNYGGFEPIVGTLVSARPRHPKEDRGRYLSYSPFTEMYVEFPVFGKIVLDPKKFPEGASIIYQIIVDGISGMGMLRLYSGESITSDFGYQPEIRFAKIGVSVALAEASPNLLGGIMSAVGTAGSIATGNVLGELQGIGNAFSSTFNNVNVSGQNGGIELFFQPARFVCTFYDVADDDPSHLGKPLCKKVKLSSLSGYTVVNDAEVNIPCTAQEKSSIKSYMEGGFYIE